MGALGRLLAAGLVIFVAFSVVAPLLVVHGTSVEGLVNRDATPSALDYPSTLSTNATVPEYPLVSRALDVPGGSTDCGLGDFNDDGLVDMVVSVSGSKCLAVFFRQSSGQLPSFPSLTIPLAREPLALAVADLFRTGRNQIVVLEDNNTALDSDRLEFYNITAQGTYQFIMDRQPYADSSDILVGNFTGDTFLDIAVASPGLSPASIDGEIQIFIGPSFGSSLLLLGGRGSNSLCMVDADDNNVSDLALANYVDGDVMVFTQPFSNFMHSTYHLQVDGNPISVESGHFDGDAMDDLIVSSYDQSSLVGKVSFYYQALHLLPATESANVTVNLHPTSLHACDEDNDGQTDTVLVLSRTSSTAAILTRNDTGPIWQFDPRMEFPTGAGPRAALFGSFDSSGTLGVAISSARNDWSGSSIMIIPDIVLQFSNSNGTLWTNRDVITDSFCVGDLDNDGKADLITRHHAANAFGYALANGDSKTVALGYTPSHLLVKDFNSDGFDDILITADSGNESTLYFGSSSGPASPVALRSTGNLTDVTVGDFDYDGNLDVVTAAGSNELNIFFNSGNEVTPFGAPTVVALQNQIHAVCTGDFDSDGRDDIAYSHPNRAIGILLQKDSPPFISPSADMTLSAPSGADFGEIWSGDITGDGATDLVGMMPADTKLYLFNQTEFVSSPHPFATLDFPEIPYYTSVIDVTDDGHADVVVAYNSADMLFLYRQSAGGLPAQPSMVFATGAGPNWVDIGDGTGDGRVDLLVNNAESHAISAWEMINTAPVSVAGGPYYGFEGDPVVLSGSAVTQVSELPMTDFRWDFGDGNSSGWTHDPMASHIYAVQNTYNATLTVRDPFNTSFVNSSSTRVTIADGVPHVSFTWTPSSPYEGELVEFDDTSTSFDPVVQIDWSVDGVLASSGLSHSISRQLDNGLHNVTLQLRDSDGSVNSTSQIVSVSRRAPSASIASARSASEETPVVFYAVVDPWHLTGDTISSYKWNFSYTSGPFDPDESTGTTNNTIHMFHSSASHANYTIALNVTDVDGDWSLAFTNITIYDKAIVTVSCTTPGVLYEFMQVNLSASVDSAYTASSFDWDFDSEPSGFVVDATTVTGEANHTYTKHQNYLVKVRVHMSNGSYSFGSVSVYPEDLGLSGTSEDLLAERNPADTSNISFDARVLAARYPDINRTIWDFDDSSTKESGSGPVGVVTHKFTPNRDYTVALTLTDDDGNVLVIQKTMRLNAPVIELRSPPDASVTRSDTPMRFSITDDSMSLVSVQYSLDGNGYQNFTRQWEIPTDLWPDGRHVVIVRAEDPDGNIAHSTPATMIIDDEGPAVTMQLEAVTIYGGSKINITATIVDPNISPTGVFLYVKFPGDDSYSSFPMIMATGDEFYRVIEVPTRAGSMEYYVLANDLASNSGQSTSKTVEIRLHFFDFFLPYLMLLMALAVIGTAGYFMREAKIAVDETFVIYNDGRLISHSTRRLKPGMDDQILSSMLAAIQDFVRESFKDVTSFNIRKLEFGDKSVLIEKGDNLFLAVILHGKASKKVATRMRRVVSEIEGKFGEHLTDWDGDLDKVRGVNDLVKKLYSKAPLLAPSLNRRDT